MKKLNLFIVFIFALFLVGCFLTNSDICANTGQLILVNEDLSCVSAVDPPEVVFTFTLVESSELVLSDNSYKQSGVAITSDNCSNCHWGWTDWHPFKPV